MKKFAPILLALCMLLSACSGATHPGTSNPAPSNPAPGDNAQPDTEPQETPDTDPGTDKTQSIETDENLLTVDITIPASMFVNEDMSAFDPDAYAAENKFSKAVVNEDGSVTATMTKGRHKELLAETRDGFITGFEELVGGEDTPYITKITVDDDMKEITVEVDATAYKDAFDMTPLMLVMSSAMYQAFTTEGVTDTVVNTIDNATGEVLNTYSTKDLKSAGQ